MKVKCDVHMNSHGAFYGEELHKMLHIQKQWKPDYTVANDIYSSALADLSPGQPDSPLPVLGQSLVNVLQVVIQSLLYIDPGGKRQKFRMWLTWDPTNIETVKGLEMSSVRINNRRVLVQTWFDSEPDNFSQKLSSSVPRLLRRVHVYSAFSMN